MDQLIADGVDCLSNLTDNTVVGVLGAILEKTDAAGIPCLWLRGRAGEAGLRGRRRTGTTCSWASRPVRWPPRSSPARPPARISPYETIENYGLYINSDSLSALGITVPEDIAQSAQECAE